MHWDEEVYQLYNGEVEGYKDGSVRYHHDVSTRVLTPLQVFRQPVHAQGGLLFHFGLTSKSMDAPRISLLL